MPHALKFWITHILLLLPNLYIRLDQVAYFWFFAQLVEAKMIFALIMNISSKNPPLSLIFHVFQQEYRH